ncbi:MAG: hypothetical protein ACTH31_13265 [Pseudoclavibacter sp.]
MDTESLDLTSARTRQPADPTASDATDARITDRSTSPNDRGHSRERECEHGWMLESRHATSAGFVVYVRCTDCGARRVDMQQLPWMPPEALSRPLR